jgi:hypothetical protein
MRVTLCFVFGSSRRVPTSADASTSPYRHKSAGRNRIASISHRELVLGTRGARVRVLDGSWTVRHSKHDRVLLNNHARRLASIIMREEWDAMV